MRRRTVASENGFNLSPAQRLLHNNYAGRARISDPPDVIGPSSPYIVTGVVFQVEYYCPVRPQRK